MDLSQIAANLFADLFYPSKPIGDIDITHVTHNSAWVRPGSLFVAVGGLVRDGHDFVPQALEKGAVAIIGEGYDDMHNLPVPYLHVGNARQALADSAAMIHDYPSQKLAVVGVTGTKGKTSTSWLVRHLLKSAGYKTGLLSTLGYKFADDELLQFPAHFTTPEAPQVQEILAEMVAHGITHVVVEASSEALALERLRSTQFDVAIWTNLSPEHLNFHKNMARYFEAKRRLFQQSKFGVINRLDEWGRRLEEDDRFHTTYAASGDADADWQALQIKEAGAGIEMMVLSPAGAFTAVLPMIGTYNVSNALGAMAAAHSLGVSIDQLCDGLASFKGVPGRMQILQTEPARIIADFAHTPDSLENALRTLRPSTVNRLIVVIGSAGGNRDPAKRAPLGRVAAQYADVAIFTEEDSRDTPIWDILHEMERGAKEAGFDNFLSIPNRVEALTQAIEMAQAGDTVVACGKAGEITLERMNETIAWDEVSVIEEIVQSVRD